jgi:hypothetical protein
MSKQLFELMQQQQIAEALNLRPLAERQQGNIS